MRILARGMFIAIAMGAASLGASAANTDPPQSLDAALAILRSHRFVDLTHTFAPGIPHWKGAPNETAKTLYTVQKDGFRINEYCHIGQWGTHVDPPAHFHEGLHTVDQIDPKDMLMPLVVIDVHEKVAKNPDYTLQVADINAWEARHGRIPRGAFVAMRTDWSKRWPDQAAMMNIDAKGVYHYPGWSMRGAEAACTKSAASPPRGTRRRTRTRAPPRPRTTIRSSRTFWDSITTRSKCWRIWTRCPKRAASSG